MNTQIPLYSPTLPDRQGTILRAQGPGKTRAYKAGTDRLLIQGLLGKSRVKDASDNAPSFWAAGERENANRSAFIHRDKNINASTDDKADINETIHP
ncbi:MAG: hypothetical protein OHK0053_30250 [Microscillaceae bacterium]